MILVLTINVDIVNDKNSQSRYKNLRSIKKFIFRIYIHVQWLIDQIFVSSEYFFKEESKSSEYNFYLRELRLKIPLEYYWTNYITPHYSTRSKRNFSPSRFVVRSLQLLSRKILSSFSNSLPRQNFR